MKSKTGTGKYEKLVPRCRKLAPAPTAVAFPCEETTLSAAIEAGKAGLIDPILVGPSELIRAIAKKHRIDLGSTEIVEAEDGRSAAAKAVELVRLGKAEVLMKGSLHTDELLGAVVARDGGLRRRRSGGARSMRMSIMSWEIQIV